MRRIVTQNDADGRSQVMQIDEVAPGTVIWETDPERPLGFEPRDVAFLEFVPGGLKAINMILPPDAIMAEYLKQGIPGLDENGFHRPGTLDFVMLLEGELTLELDEGTVRLEPGDIVVQRDTNHAWRNSSDKPARCLAISHLPPQAAGYE